MDIEKIEELLRQGHRRQVRELLASVKPKQIARAKLAAAANLARRAGTPQLALTLLKPFVHPEIRVSPPASPREMAIYAAALSDLGAVSEALDLLKPLARDSTPEVLLYRSFAQIYSWDYAAAASGLSRYARLKGISEYQRTIARLNLAACYRYLEKDRQLMPLLEEILALSRRHGWTLLLRNALDLAAQSAIFRGEWAEARDILDQNEKIGREFKLDQFLVAKWRAVLELQRDGWNASTSSRLAEARAAAIASGNWETQRDLDYYQALAARDQALGLCVLFGTPFPSFRKRLLNKAKTWLGKPNEYVRALGGGGPELCLITGKSTLPDLQLPDRSVLLRLMRALAGDFYRPLKVAALFAQIYPDERFNPVHSPERVRAVVKRLRKQFEAAGFPLAIEAVSGGFRLTAPEPVSLRVALSYPDQRGNDFSHLSALARLKTEWPYRAFSAKQAAQILGIHAVSARELLRSASETRRVYRSGKGQATRYRFAK